MKKQLIADILVAALFIAMVASTIHADAKTPATTAPEATTVPEEIIISNVEITKPEQTLIQKIEAASETDAAEEEKDLSDLQKIRCTCYVPTGNATASGVMPYEGICASNQEHMGLTARIYTLEGELIGDFLSIDTGGHPMLKEGTSIDIYRDDMERVWDWIETYGDYVLIEWIEPEE